MPSEPLSQTLSLVPPCWVLQASFICLIFTLFISCFDRHIQPKLPGTGKDSYAVFLNLASDKCPPHTGRDAVLGAGLCEQIQQHSHWLGIRWLPVYIFLTLKTSSIGYKALPLKIRKSWASLKGHTFKRVLFPFMHTATRFSHC